MSGFLGADTARLRATSTLFLQRTHVLQETAQHTLNLVQAVDWVGPDADAFRAESAALAERLTQLAVEVREQAMALRDHADEQDEASADAGGADGRGIGAWRPDIERLRDLFPWPLGAPGGTGSWRDPVSDPIRLLNDKIQEVVLEVIDKVAGPHNPFWKAGRKVVPGIPELFGMGQDLGEGDTPGFLVGHLRFVVSVTQLSWIEDASSYILPTMPDHWTYPGTNVHVNEGSLLDGLESIIREEYESPSTWQTEQVKAAEADAMEISDRLGIENEYARNAIKTFAGTATGFHIANRDPVTGEEGDRWVLAAPMGRG